MMPYALPRTDRTLLTATSALMGAAALFFLASSAHAAFDPNADTSVHGPSATISTNRLPDTSVLSQDTPVRPLYTTGAPLAVNPSPASAPANIAPLSPTPNANYVSTLEPIKMPRPLYPTRSTVVATQPVQVPADVRAPIVAAAPAAPTVIAAPAPLAAPKVAAAPTIPNLPPVDDATAARANAIIAAEKQPIAKPEPITVAAPVIVPAAPAASASFIAPAPLLAIAPASAPKPAPVAVATPAPRVVPPTVMASPAPAVAAPATPVRMTPPPAAIAAAPIEVPAAPIVMASAPSPTLSDQSRSVLSTVPSRMDSAPQTKTTSVSLERVSPQIQAVLGKEAQEENYESVGLSIKVRRPGLDTTHELNNAYTALMGGDTTRAINIYKDILGAEPKNEDALFGLAATYHRLGNEEAARPFYAMLLKQNPNHREALNNFLVLVSDESPQDALPELERLELRNPDFSPIPAQIAIVYEKLGYPAQAREKMLRAIELAPENLTYKYNLAIMLDRQKQYADAVALYRLLIQAAMNGEQVPASLESLQQRLTYITTAATSGRLGS